jgi:hypothetical protein
MWYWVKNPDGTETDYDVPALTKATKEGKVSLDWSARRAPDGRRMTVKEVLILHQKYQDDEAITAATRQQEPHRQPQIACTSLLPPREMCSDTAQPQPADGCSRSPSQTQRTGGIPAAIEKLQLNRTQRAIILAGIAVFVLMGVFPPWTCRPFRVAAYAEPCGYRFIASSPSGDGVKIDTSRLFIQWAVTIAATGFGVLLVTNRRQHQ